MHILDCTDLKCPLPLLKLKVALASLPKGELIRLTTTDPVSLRDISAFCEHMGLHLATHVIGNTHEFFIHEKSTSNT